MFLRGLAGWGRGRKFLYLFLDLLHQLIKKLLTINMCLGLVWFRLGLGLVLVDM